MSWSFDEKFGFQYPRVALVAWINFSSRTIEFRSLEHRENLLFPSSFSFFSPPWLDFPLQPHFFPLSFFFLIFFSFSFFFFLFFLLFGFHSIELFLFSFFVGLIPSERKLPLTFLSVTLMAMCLHVVYVSCAMCHIDTRFRCHLPHHMALMP